MTIHISLDLETWGTTPGSDIRSIGACVFDPVSGEVSIPCQTCKGGTTRGNVNDGGDCSDCMNTRMEQGYGDTFYLATNNPMVGARKDVPSYRLKRDPATVKWWSEQSPEAQSAFADPVDLREALIEFGEWLQLVRGTIHQYDMSLKPGDDIRLWSHGAAFDPPILAAAYEAVGLPVPWHYRAPRDTRTLFDVAGIEDHSAWLAQHPGPLGVAHHALDDAICQARAICAAWARVRSDATIGV